MDWESGGGECKDVTLGWTARSSAGAGSLGGGRSACLSSLEIF